MNAARRASPHCMSVSANCGLPHCVPPWPAAPRVIWDRGPLRPAAQYSTAASRTVLHYSLAKCLTLRLAALYVTLDMLISSHLMYLAALSAEVRPLRPTALTSPATCHITPLPRMYSLGFKQAPSLLCVPLPSALKSDHYGRPHSHLCGRPRSHPCRLYYHSSY